MLACVACGTSPPSKAPAAPAAPKPPATRDELLAATLAALAASDRAALDRLTDDSAMDRLLDCRDPVKAHKARERYRKREAELVAALGGAPLELVGVDDDKTLRRVAAGDPVGVACTAKLAFETHALAVTVKAA